MKPILFPSTETTFTTQGIGFLDCASCVVTEERNGIFEVVMTIATSANHYDQCVEGNILYVIHNDTKKPQPFQIYKRTKPINGVATVYAEHISYRLGMIVTTPFTSSGVVDAFNKLKQNAVEGCPFTFWTDKNSRGSFSVDEPCSIRSKLGGEQGSILDAFGGGEYEWDHFTVKLHQHRGHDEGVTLRKRKNITDYTKNTTLEGIYTAIVPYYVDSDGVITLPEKVLRLDGAATGKTVAVNLSDKFTEKPTVAQLRTAGNTYLQANARNYVSENAKVSFVALWQTEEYKDVAPLQRVNLCDTVTIVYDDNDSVKSKVIKTVYNALLERYDSIELGEASVNMNTAIKSITDALTGEDVSKTEMQKALDHAAALITGVLGGYVVFNRNANGEPQEILIMDSPTKETAVNVIRMNKNGIAFSQKGYNGPFNTAWTIDSRFVADFITAGTLTASIIKAGILGDKANKNYWNMVTGDFSLSAGAKVGGDNIANTKNVSNAVKDYDDSLDQTKVFNRLTNNGQLKGIYMSSGQLYMNADYIKTGKLEADRIKVGDIYLSGGQITSGTLDPVRIPDLSANKIKSGTIDANIVNIKNLNANNIKSGTIDASKITVKNLNASNISSGTLDPVRIPDLSADKITSGTIDASKITVKNLDASNITSGTISADLIKGGVITSSNGKTKYNLNDGVLEQEGDFSSARLSGGQLTVKSHDGAYTSFFNYSTLQLANNCFIGGIIQTQGGTGGISNSFRGDVYFHDDVHFNGNVYGISTSSSDRNKKKEISDLNVDSAIDFIMDIRPREYKFKDGTSNRFHHGFIAQEIQEAMNGDDWGVYAEWEEENGKTCGIRYNEIIADLVAVVQDQQKRINALEERIG